MINHILIRSVSNDEYLICHLVGAADRVVKTYSGGMHHRLDLAVSLIVSPLIIILDEPTTGLDPKEPILLLYNANYVCRLSIFYLDLYNQLSHQMSCQSYLI
jgi:ABC-type transporter Mla maintaining outer membrane lipid asymmetry ATPase subunit MlaF